MKKGKRYTVVFTENELNVVIEAVGHFKHGLKSKADNMRKRHGIQPKGRHTLRSEYARTAQRKLTNSHEPKETKMKPGRYFVTAEENGTVTWHPEISKLILTMNKSIFYHIRRAFPKKIEPKPDDYDNFGYLNHVIRSHNETIDKCHEAVNKVQKGY